MHVTKRTNIETVGVNVVNTLSDKSNDDPVPVMLFTLPRLQTPREWFDQAEPGFNVLELRFLTPPDQIAARYSLGCDCRSCLASTFRPVGVSIFSASSFSSRCSAC